MRAFQRLSKGGRYWAALWCAWGLAIALLILWIDGAVEPAALWIVLGVGVGSLAAVNFEWISIESTRWYDSVADAWDPQPDQVETTPEFAARLEGWREFAAQDEKLTSEEQEALAHLLARDVTHSMLGVSLLIPPLGGAMWGGVTGPFIGILAKFDPRFEITAAFGAMIGLAGMIAILTVVLTLALFVALPYHEPSVSGRAHWLLLLAPVLIVGFALHCARLCWRRRTRPATS